MFLSEHENLSLGIFNRKNELLEWHTELGRINILNYVGAFEGGSFGEFPFFWVDFLFGLGFFGFSVCFLYFVGL